MKISCPQCGASGNLPDHQIPEEGRFVSCPRCKHGFTVNRPRPSGNTYLVDTCPACQYSTFGDERFENCPKCGIVVKSFVERQREEQQRQREQELLTKTFARDLPAPEPEPETHPVAGLIEAMHPVKLTGWGAAAVAAVILALGLWGVAEYLTSDIRGRILAERDEQVSALYVFMHYGLMPWIETMFGGALMASSVLFLKHRAIGRVALSWLLRSAIAFVPLYQVVGFVQWVLEPVPHGIPGYFTEIASIIFISALVCIPLALLDRYLDERPIRTVVKL